MCWCDRREHTGAGSRISAGAAEVPLGGPSLCTKHELAAPDSHAAGRSQRANTSEAEASAAKPWASWPGRRTATYPLSGRPARPAERTAIPCRRNAVRTAVGFVPISAAISGDPTHSYRAANQARSASSG